MMWILLLVWIRYLVALADNNIDGKLVFRPLVHQPRIYSGAPAGIHVTTVHAYDPDKPRKRVEYNLPNVLDYRHFVVDNVSGNLSTALKIEKSVGETYQVMVAAVGSGSSELEHLQIAVTEFNQFAPRFQHRNYTLELHPGIEPETSVLKVHAIDPDPDPGNAEIYYKLDQNASSRFFTVNSFTGEMSLNQVWNQSETLQNFGVFAEDGGSPKRWDYVPVIVVVKTVSAPQTVSVFNITHDSAVICWDAPLYGNVSGYVLRYFPLDIEEQFQMNVTLNDESSVCERVENLTDETEYFLQIFGWNAEEDGQKTEVSSFNTTENWCKKKATCQAAGQCIPMYKEPFYSCMCPAGFYGPSCEFFDPCSLHPCSDDGGRCLNVTHNEFVCVCQEDYHGPDCGSYNPCLRGTGGPCENAATCEMTTGRTYVCLCTEGFVGERCELRNLCLENPCLNGGTCNSSSGIGYVCSCPVGFAGVTCEKDLDECASNPCHHGSTCINGKGRFSCVCPSGVSGLNCEVVAQCVADKTETDEGLFYWNATNHSEEGILPCPFGSLDSNSDPFARRPCLLLNDSVVWGAINASACKGKEFMVADELADELHSLTKDPNTLNVETLETAAQGLETIASFATQDKKLAEGMAKVISNLMDVNDTVVKQDQNDTYTEFSESVLQTVDNFVSNVEIKPGESLQLESENVLIQAMDWNPNVDNAIGDYDLKFTVPNQNDLKVEEETTPEDEVDQLEPTSQATNMTTTMRPQNIPPTVPMVKVYLPKEALQEAHRQLEGSVRVKFVVYYNDKLFQSKVDEQESTRAPVTSNDVDNNSGKVELKTKKEEPEFKAPVLQISVGNVTLKNMYKPLVYVIPLTTKRDVICVYWNAKKRHWSSDGLTTNHTRNYVICQSTHMTAFSVLLDLTPKSPRDKMHEPILSVISYVGSALSILGLTLTIITYLLFGCLNRDQTGRILSNLCFSLLLMNATFLLGMLEPPLGGHLCAGVGLLLHYLVLASLCWMCVEAVNMYQLLVHVFASSETHFMLKRCFVAWGGPFLIVAVTATTNTQAYYEGLQYCMLSPQDPWIYYCSFLAPSCLILVVNFTVFVLVSRVIFTPRLTAKASFDPQPTVTAAQVRGAFTVMVLLGVTWVFGTLALGDIKIIFQYAFCIANSLQGFLIFLVRCLLYPEARNAWSHLFRTGRLKKHRGVVPPGTVSFSNSQGGGRNVASATHQSATRNNSSEDGVVALDSSLFGRKRKNSNKDNTKGEIWIPSSQIIDNNSPNENDIPQLKQNIGQFVVSKNDKNTFPKVQKKKNMEKRRTISHNSYQTNPTQDDEIFTITNSKPFQTLIIPNPYNKEGELNPKFNKETSKFVPATITKRNLHLPYYEKQDVGHQNDTKCASSDFVSNLEGNERNEDALSTTTIENLKMFLANVKLRSNEDAILEKRSFCVNSETSEVSTKPQKAIPSSRKARVNRRMAFKRKKSNVFQKEDEQTDDEDSTSTDVDDGPSCADQPRSRRGSRRSKNSRNGAGNRHPKNNCYHCRFSNGCDDSSLPYTPPTSLRRT